MMNKKELQQSYTPGPYTTNGVSVTASNDQLIAVLADDNSVANARLIASAPDLLEALKEIEVGEGPYKINRLEFAESVIGNMKRRARAAIAKATEVAK